MSRTERSPIVIDPCPPPPAAGDVATARRLGRRLGSVAACEGVHGTDPTLVDVGAGRAGSGTVLRLDGAGAAPVVLKWADASPQHRERAEREVRFLASTGAGLPVRVPRLLATGSVGEPPRLLLVLEWLVGEPGDAEAGCDEAAAVRTVRAVARMHAAFAGGRVADAPAAAVLPRWGVGSDTGPRPHARRAARFAKRLGPFAARRSIPAPLLAHLEALAATDAAGVHAIEAAYARLAALPVTLVHADLHLDNLLFAPGDDPAGVGVLDWQSASIGPGVADLVRFVVESCPDRGVLGRAAEAWRAERLAAGDDAATIDRELVGARDATDALLAGIVSGFGGGAADGLGCRADRLLDRLFGADGLVRLVA